MRDIAPMLLGCVGHGHGLGHATLSNAAARGLTAIGKWARDPVGRASTAGHASIFNSKGAQVIHRELTATDLGNSALLDLIGHEDPAGVLSIYVDASPERGSAIDIKNRLAELEHRMAIDGSAALAESLRQGRGLMTPTLERLLDARTSGRGRAIFASLDGSDVTSVSTRLPLSNRVVIDSRAFVHPLLELLDEGRPTGVVVAAGHGADILDWRLGELRPLTRITPEPLGSRSEPSGPVGGNTARAQRTTPMREQQAGREREQLLRWLDVVAAEVFLLVDERGWEHVVLIGDDRLTRPLADAFPHRVRDLVLIDSRQLDPDDLPRLTAAIAESLEGATAERNRLLTHRVRDAALGLGKGALGLSEVVAALNEARVEHLVYDPDVRYTGAMAANGSLFAGDEAVGAVVKEPRLIERIVERCLLTNARITPVAGAATGVLEDANGIGALLRW